MATADGLTAGRTPDPEAGPLEDAEILNIIGQELQQASGGNENDFIDANRQDALSYYLGSKNGKEVEGRSSIVSTDVADAIEWIMPAIMKQFTANNEIVHFDPVFEGDEDQAALESQYCYDILMKRNDGFNIIHTLVKDSLMQKNGIIKSFYEQVEIDEIKWFTGIGMNGMQVLLSEDGVRIIEQTENPPEEGQNEPTYDIKVHITTMKGQITVMAIPPEEFRIARQHNSINVDTARFSAHVMLKSRSDLVKEGYDTDIVYALPAGQEHDDDRDYRFYMQNETVYPDRSVSNDGSQEEIEISECFINIDIDRTGVSQLYKIVVSGGDNPDHLLGYEPIDKQPFNAATAIMMSHKFFGLSVYDRLKQIQDQKTTLWRNMFDNLYLQNNQRNVVLEGQVNLDDLMVSRPGGIIRAKTLGAVQPLQTPMLGQEAYQMMDYLDQVRAGRAGVSPEGSIQVNNIGDRVGSQGIEKLMTAKEELVGLMIRVIAETCIKPLMYRIRDMAIMHNDVIEEYKFRGYWTQTNPSEWLSRTNSTVRVGTGTGDRAAIASALQMVIELQGTMSDDATGMSQVLVSTDKIFNAVNDFGKAAGLLGVREYFVDPKSPEGKKAAEGKSQNDQAQQEEMKKKDEAMMQMQVDLAKAETTKAQAQLATSEAKAKESAIKLKLEHASQLQDIEKAKMDLKLQAAQMKIDIFERREDQDFKHEELDTRAALELTRIESQEHVAEQNQNFKSNKESASD